MHQVLRATLCVAVAVMNTGAHAQTYPTRSVRIIASALPGDACDTLARLVGMR